MSAPHDTVATTATAGGFTPWPADAGERYRAEGYWRDETLPGLLRGWAQRSGEREALTAGAARISYAELDTRVDHAAAGFAALGIAPGDRVVVHLPNTAAFVVVLFGLMRAGALPVLALPAHRRAEIEHLAALAEAVAYVVPDAHEGFDHRVLAREVADAVPSVRHVIVAGDPGEHTGLDAVLERGVGTTGFPELDPGDPAVLLISGGTTGKPKLIPRTHRDYAYNARASAEVTALTADDVYLVCLPAAHNFPLACPGMLGAFGVGARVVMSPAPGPDAAFGLITAERVTVTALVPPLVRLWLEAATYEAGDRSSLRLLQVGGAKLDAASARRVRPVLGCALQQVFGMAEGLLNYTRLDDPDDVVAETQGRPLAPADEVRVVDAAGHDVADGTVGELFTRGPYTLRGYYRAEAHNATAFTPDGFFRTGDLVRRRDTGHLVVEGRVKDVINRGGENVSAGELEEHLLLHPSVAQAAVLGLPDESLGELVCAVITVPPDAARAPKRKELAAHLRDRGLATFMHPDRVVVRDDLPLTGVGKIDKRRLTGEIQQEIGDGS